MLDLLLSMLTRLLADFFLAGVLLRKPPNRVLRCEIQISEGVSELLIVCQTDTPNS
jgi:hypothetical protein